MVFSNKKCGNIEWKLKLFDIIFKYLNIFTSQPLYLFYGLF